MSADQAQRLRELLQKKKNSKRTRVVAVTSGKGGVGKSNFAINFALSLVELGRKVVIIDLDVGMANIHILLGLTPRYSINDMVENNLSIGDIMEPGPKGVEFISGGSGFHRVLQMDERSVNKILSEMEKLQGRADIVLLDLGAGITDESLQFICSADEAILISTPEPTSITDAYSILKISHSRNPEVSMNLLINRAQSSTEGKQVAQNIVSVADQFLNYRLKIFGYIEEDIFVQQAVKKQMPFCLAYPNCRASKEIRYIAERYASGADHQWTEESGIKAFIRKLVYFGRK